MLKPFSKLTKSRAGHGIQVFNSAAHLLLQTRRKLACNAMWVENILGLLKSSRNNSPTFSCGVHDVDCTNHGGQRRSIWRCLNDFNQSSRRSALLRRKIYQNRSSGCCILNDGKLHGSVHHLKLNPVWKRNLFNQLTLSLEPEVWAFDLGRWAFGSSTEAAISEKVNKFDAVKSFSMFYYASVSMKTTN